MFYTKSTFHSIYRCRIQCLRFCKLDDNAGDVIALPNTVVATSNGERYLVMDNYQHFSVSGNAAGGNTDEHDVVVICHRLGLFSFDYWTNLRKKRQSFVSLC